MRIWCICASTKIQDHIRLSKFFLCLGESEEVGLAKCQLRVGGLVWAEHCYRLLGLVAGPCRNAAQQCCKCWGFNVDGMCAWSCLFFVRFYSKIIHALGRAWLLLLNANMMQTDVMLHLWNRNHPWIFWFPFSGLAGSSSPYNIYGVSVGL